MPYELTFTIHYTNEEGQEVLVSISRKDVVPDEVTDYMLTGYEITKNGKDGKFCVLATQSLLLKVFLPQGSVLDYDTFFSGITDEWLVECSIEGKQFFKGFMLPDEGAAPLQDKPYEITLRASDGWALMKSKALVKPDGTNFKGYFTLIEYIAAAFAVLGLEIPFQSRINIFQLAMFNRGDGPEFDMLSQASVNHRSWMSDANTFYSCWDVIEKIGTGWLRFEYWDGKILIKCIPEIQYNPGGEYFTNYDFEGAVVDGGLDTGNYAQVARNIDNYPILEDQSRTAEHPVKSVKTKYMYDTWPEIPLNNKFERGTEFETGPQADDYDIDGDGNTSEIIGSYSKRTIEDWTYGGYSGTPSSLPSLIGTSDLAYRKSVFDENGNELYREIILESAGAPQKFLQSEGLPVRQNDKIKLAFDFKVAGGGTGSKNIIFVYIVPSSGGSTRWSLRSQDTEEMVPYRWLNSGFGGVVKNYTIGDWADWTSFSIETPPIPVNGTLYYAFHNNSVGDVFLYRNFSFEYKTLIAGFTTTKGEYHLRSQSGNFLDTNENEIFINSSPVPMAKGALYVLSQLADGGWYRWGINESRSFKDLVNLGQYNELYRRFMRIDGSFNFLNFASENNPLDRPPLNTIKLFRFLDLPTPRDFALVPPLRMDMYRGRFNGVFVEHLNPSDTEVIGGNATIADVLQGIVDALNAAAISHGVNIVATVFGGAERTIRIVTDPGEAVDGSVDINGAGNSPSITKTLDQDGVGNYRTHFQIGTDIAIGNIYSFDLYGFVVDYEVGTGTTSTVQKDGTREADIIESKYIF